MEVIKQEKTYLLDSYLFSLNTKITQVKQDESDPNLVNILFEKTIFHPQGGGQPSDNGFIEVNGEQIPVKKLIYIREQELIFHQVEKKDSIKENQEVRIQIDENFRRQNVLLHSGGHLIDVAVNRLGYEWEAGKGYHFIDGPYVEYTINKWEEGSQDKLKDQINQELEKVLAEGSPENPSICKIYEYDEAKKEISNFPTYLPEGINIRWVKLNKLDPGCPCGGTHVKNVSDFKKVVVNKIQKKGKKIKVSYTVQ
ncbi:hypothetical protein ABPG72_004531 [Tetrahymena utriculariae]